MGASLPSAGDFGDDPIESDEDDLFGRGSFADRAVELLDHVASSTPSAVLGLIGPWGGGKTSVLRLVQTRLRSKPDWRVVELNPWMVSDLGSLIDDFFRTLAGTLPEGRRGKQIRRRLAEYAGLIAAAGSPLRLVGVDAAGALSGVGSLLQGDQSIDARRRELEKDLRELDAPILVIIDDLDRLQPDELLLVLKLVRLVGRLPRTYYLLSFDERTAIDVLLQTGLAHNDAQRAVAYLEKVIQVRLDLPPVEPLLVERLLETSLGLIEHRHSIEWIPQDQQRFGRAYREHMRHFLSEPRQVKRYCNQIDAMYPLLDDEVNFTDFALITFLRTFHPGVVAMLMRYRDELTGMSLEYSLRNRTKEQSADAWRERLTDASGSSEHVESLFALLRHLFKKVAEAAGPHLTFGGQAEHRSVGSSEYFDRYFILGVGQGDIADSAIREALAELVADGPGANWAALSERIEEIGALILDKMRRYAPSDAAASERLALEVIAFGQQVPDRGLLDHGPAVWRIWMAELIGAANPADLVAFTRELVDRGGLLGVARACHQGLRRAAEESVEVPSTLVGVTGELVALIRAQLDSEARNPPRDTENVYGLLNYWTIFERDASVGQWFEEALALGVWTYPELLGIFASVGSMSGGSGRVPALGDPDLDLLEKALGRRSAVDALGDALQDSGHGGWTRDVTWEARVASVITALARWSRGHRDAEGTWVDVDLETIGVVEPFAESGPGDASPNDDGSG